MIFFSPRVFIPSILAKSLGSAYGPFFKDRPIVVAPLLTTYLPLRTIYFVVRLFRRVLKPRAGLPHGVIGLLRPTGDLPSPPPWGWSRGFITTPLFAGRLPSHRTLPALPYD